MRPAVAAAVVTFTLVQIFGFFNSGPKEFMHLIGMYNFLGGILFFLVGLVLLVPKQTREIGQGILIASGILFIIGLATCSGFN
jgi:hypothetical protein